MTITIQAVLYEIKIVWSGIHKHQRLKYNFNQASDLFLLFFYLFVIYKHQWIF